MKKIILILIVVATIILLVTVYFWIFNYNKYIIGWCQNSGGKYPCIILEKPKYDLMENNQPESIDECDKEKDEIEQANCYINLARVQRDISICDNIKIIVLKNSCESLVASQTKNVGACNNLNKDAREECYRGIAISTNNLDLCDKITSSSVNRDGCILTIAEHKKDISICEKISDANTKKFCINLVSKANSNFQNQASITVNSPTVGDKWLLGKTYNITWNATNMGKLIIQLILNNDNGKLPSYVAGDIPAYNISTNINSNQESFSWKVPQDLKLNYFL